jgi:hypothetical protein
MRYLLIIIGFLTFPLSAYALNAPERPEVKSEYVKSVLKKVEQTLGDATADNFSDCDQNKSAQTAIQSFREMLFDADAVVVQPQKDVARSMCYMQDIQALERYIADLIDLSIENAWSCNSAAGKIYREEAVFIWDMLLQVRRYGLNPRMQIPVSGERVEFDSANTDPTSDDALCPYYSEYAPIGFDGAGCYGEGYPIWDVSYFMEEYEDALPEYYNMLVDIIEEANRFVKAISIRDPFPRIVLNPIFPSHIAPNAEESGCKGWPSDVGGVVTGENIPLMEYSPVVLTTELADAIAFIQERSTKKWYEYEKTLDEQAKEQGGGAIGGQFMFPDITSINSDHLDRETSSILSIRDPQEKMESIADSLHLNTKKFSAEVQSSDNDSIRGFIRQYSEFLARMCVNRGCGHILLRAIELSLKDECFSAFNKDRDSLSVGAGSSNLGSCRASYTGP